MCERPAKGLSMLQGAALRIEVSHEERVTSSHKGDSQDKLSRSRRTQEGKSKRPSYKFGELHPHGYRPVLQTM